MKKLFTLIAAMCCAVASFATDYTDSLEIYINGATTPVTTPATISVNSSADGTLSFTLKNFKLLMAGQTMNVGNVFVDSVPVRDGGNGRQVFYKKVSTQIQNGDEAGVTWVGPMLQTVTVDLAGYTMGNRAYCFMNIDVPATAMTIVCKFGSGFQFLNPGFEDYHTATISMGGNSATSDEPNHWHSFMSASGNAALAYLAGYNPHTFISNVVAPGSTGSHSLMITSLDMWFAIANGTVTTGRINTGSTQAASLSNHAWLDLDSTGVDDNGDPFYQYMNGRPDSLSVWVKFTQSKPNASHPYATVSAVITDGTYYQEPTDKTYGNILAEARNNKIETKGGVWQHLTFPFDYKDNSINGKAILCTISTNADPGQGSTDTLWVDDISLVYNNTVKSVTLNGTTKAISDAADANVTFEGNGDLVNLSDVQIEAAPHSIVFPVSQVVAGEDEVLTYRVFADDLSSSIPVTVTVTGAVSGIENVNTVTKTGAEVLYNLNGQRITTPRHGQVYVVKKANGTTKKVLK